MMQSIADISVIICAYTAERWNDLISAVESVQRQTLLPREIIVVVDHNPGLVKRMREYMPGVVVVENREARGLSGARNSGIAATKSKIIAFLDDDAVATPDWLRLLSEGFADPRVLGVGGAVIPHWLSHKPAWFPAEFHWVVGCSYLGMPLSTMEIRNPIGANMAFRREIFDNVGGFRHGIGRVGMKPLGCEETELCIQARNRWPQKIFLYQPAATVFHRIPENRTHWRYFCSRCYAEGLSKANVARFVGAKDALASERTYTLRTLPLGIVHGLRDGLLHYDLAGPTRAGAIVLGLTVTTAGYLVGNTIMRVKNMLPGERASFHTPKTPSVKAEI